MFKRKITAEMMAWKNEAGRKKALVIKGLRQIGKTYSVLAFARENYESVVYINFKDSASMRSAFEGDFAVDRITLDISAMMPKARFIPGKTVLIFDEVQECGNARASVKAFMEDGRYDVICTGSLLGIKGYSRKKGQGIPTGSERILYMKPMDFEEFLWAKGVGEGVIAELRACLAEHRPVRPAIHQAMIRYYREYICVGGLPYVVDRFLATNDMNAVRREQLDILDEYRDDFGKHLDENEREEVDLALLARINRVFASIPAQLAKENKKFVYSLLEKKGRSQSYQEAIQWLQDAGLISLCRNLSSLSLPLEGNVVAGVFKVYVQDTGLFVAMLEEGTAGRILTGDLGVYKGAIYENMIADCLSKKGKGLYYFHRESGMEIDFVTVFRGEPVLVEAKASNGNTKSADAVLRDKARYGVSLCIKCGEANVGYVDGKLTVPAYMAFLLF